MLQNIRRVRCWLLPLRQCLSVVALLSVVRAQSPAKPTLPADQGRPDAKQSLAASGAASAIKFAYFFDLTGDFEKIALATGEEVAHGQIPPAVGIVDPFQQSGFDGCVFCGARYDGRLGRLYAVMAKEASTSEDDTKPFAIVALDLPQMKVAASVDIGMAQPVVLLTPDGQTLLASYQLSSKDAKSNELSFDLSVYSAPSLKLLQTIRESTTIAAYTGGAVIKAKLSEQAYFGADSKTIYDEFSKSELAGDKITREEINPSELLAKSQDKLLEPFRLVNPQTKASFFFVNYADSEAGKALVALNAGKNAPQAVLTIDLNTKSLSPAIGVAQVTVSTAHLTPDGKQILFENSELRHPTGAKPDEPQEAIFKTGTLLIFNTATGEKVREIKASDISGFDSHLVCISSDDRLAFFAHAGHLFGVDLVAGTVSRERTRPGFVFDQWTQCVLADR
jgi:hypothetical protein